LVAVTTFRWPPPGSPLLHHLKAHLKASRREVQVAPTKSRQLAATQALVRGRVGPGGLGQHLLDLAADGA
jgi:hypothetical protein